MLEAPEANILARQLNETVKGKKITTIVLGHTPNKFAWMSGDQAYYEKMLLNKSITETVPCGGYLEVIAQDVSLLFAEGVNLKYIAPGNKLPDKHQLLIGFDDESCITVSVRMYGGLMCFPKGQAEGGFKPYYDSAKTKPQVMSGGFTKEYFSSLANASGMAGKSAKAFLATKQTIPGLGNGVLQDILFNAGIHPKRKLSSMDETAKEKLYTAVTDTLKQMYESGGRDSETDLFGNSGGYKAYLSKDTAGNECPKCGSIIVKENYMGGSIYYCPGCQKL